MRDMDATPRQATGRKYFWPGAIALGCLLLGLVTGCKDVPSTSKSKHPGLKSSLKAGFASINMPEKSGVSRIDLLFSKSRREAPYVPLVANSFFKMTPSCGKPPHVAQPHEGTITIDAQAKGCRLAFTSAADAFTLCLQKQFRCDEPWFQHIKGSKMTLYFRIHLSEGRP